MLDLQVEDVCGLVSGENRAGKELCLWEHRDSRCTAHSLRKVLFGNLGCEKQTCMARPLRLSSVAVWIRREKTQSDWQPERREGSRGERKSESLGSNWFHCIHFVCVFPSVGNGHKSTCSFGQLCMIFQSAYHRGECFWFFSNRTEGNPMYLKMYTVGNRTKPFGSCSLINVLYMHWQSACLLHWGESWETEGHKGGHQRLS